MRLAIALLFLVSITHYGYSPLSLGHADPQYTAQAWFYILRGLEGSCLFLVCGVLARNALVTAVCLWGFVEESQTAICRLASGVEARPQVDLFSGLCGAEFYWLGIIAALALALTFADRLRGADELGS